MSGPIEYLLVEFQGRRPPAELIVALIDLVEFRTVRLLDFVVVVKDNDGSVRSVEIDELDDEIRAFFYELDGEYDGLISDSDIEVLAEDLPEGSAAVALIWENIWASAFAESVRATGGQVLVQERLPQQAVEETLAELAALSSSAG